MPDKEKSVLPHVCPGALHRIPGDLWNISQCLENLFATPAINSFQLHPGSEIGPPQGTIETRLKLDPIAGAEFPS